MEPKEEVFPDRSGDYPPSTPGSRLRLKQLEEGLELLAAFQTCFASMALSQRQAVSPDALVNKIFDLLSLDRTRHHDFFEYLSAAAEGDASS